MESSNCGDVSALSLYEDDRPKQTVGMVVTCISKEVSLSVAEWALSNHLAAGDQLILLCVLSDTCPQSLDRSYDAGRTAEEVEKTTSHLESSCRERRVLFELRIKAGDVKSVILEEVNAVRASLVILDRNLNLQQTEDMKVSQEISGSKIMMPEMENLNLLQRTKDAERSFSSDGADEDSFSPSECGSPFFTINVSSPEAASLGHVSIMYHQIPVSVDACSTPVEFPSTDSASGFSAVHCSLGIPIRVADSLILSTSGSSFSLPGKLIAQSTSTSSSSTPANGKKSLPRSVSESNVRIHAASFIAEGFPVHVQPGLSQSQRQHGNTQERFKSLFGRSNDVFGGSGWLAEDHTIPEMDVYKARDRLSLLAGNVEKQEQNYVYAKQVTRAALPEQRISNSTENLPALSWSSLHKSMPQGGRSLLCSGCKQMSPVLRNLPRRFSYEELQSATDNFSQSNFLAEGGFGFVYKGELNGQALAVKQHKLASTQGYKEFRSEVELLSCAQHRNLVMLLGCCDENGHRMLVYEYVCNNSLDWHLSPTKNPKSLPWAARLRIAIGAARALRYLHEECRVGCIIHRDLRPNNILLTHDYEPMVGDFGLARSHPEGEEAIETRIIGTFGYLAPEYAESGQVSWKADVYAFGVVLLELITGRKAIDLLRPPGQQSLTEWARPKLVDDAMMADLVDPRLENFNMSEMHAMMGAAFHCIKKDPAARPRMSQVLHVLENENKSSDEFSRQSVDLNSATAPRLLEYPTSHIQDCVPASSSSSSLKNSLRKQQPSGSSSSSRKPPRLLYENML